VYTQVKIRSGFMFKVEEDGRRDPLPEVFRLGNGSGRVRKELRCGDEEEGGCESGTNSHETDGG